MSRLLACYHNDTARPSAEQVYAVLGSSRQAVHQYWQRYHYVQEQLLLSEKQLLSHRVYHPRLGLKKAYDMIQPAGIGRDRFVRQMTLWGHALGVKRSHIRTTRSGSHRYANLIKLLLINYINRIWQSDTTYYRLVDRFVYITFIIDVYSRLIVGYCLSESLSGQANVRALQMALRMRQGADLSELIFHSDGATQYRSGAFVALLAQHGISSSMCDVALDNAYAEKLNDVIKNEYLEPRNVRTLSQLRYHLPRAVSNYNEVRHHGSLPLKLAPMQYERYLKQHPQGHIPLLIKDGQASQREHYPMAGQNLIDVPATWLSEDVDQILPAFIKRNVPKENGQLQIMETEQNDCSVRGRFLETSISDSLGVASRLATTEHWGPAEPPCWSPTRIEKAMGF